MVMSRYYDLWSAPGTETFDFSDRLHEQAAIRRADLVEGAEPLYLPHEALDQPTSWSRTEDRPAALRELVAAYYPATARRFSLEPLPPEGTSALRVTQLSDQEFVKVTLARDPRFRGPPWGRVRSVPDAIAQERAGVGDYRGRPNRRHGRAAARAHRDAAGRRPGVPGPGPSPAELKGVWELG